MTFDKIIYIPKSQVSDAQVSDVREFAMKHTFGVNWKMVDKVSVDFSPIGDVSIMLKFKKENQQEMNL